MAPAAATKWAAEPGVAAAAVGPVGIGAGWARAHAARVYVSADDVDGLAAPAWRAGLGTCGPRIRVSVGRASGGSRSRGTHLQTRVRHVDTTRRLLERGGGGTRADSALQARGSEVDHVIRVGLRLLLVLGLLMHLQIWQLTSETYKFS